MDVDPAIEERYYDEVRHRRYAVEFIGRRSYEGRYGHMGCCRHLVVMDKLISIRELPLRKPTKADVIKAFKECEAIKACKEANKIKD